MNWWTRWAFHVQVPSYLHKGWGHKHEVIPDVAVDAAFPYVLTAVQYKEKEEGSVYIPAVFLFSSGRLLCENNLKTLIVAGNPCTCRQCFQILPPLVWTQFLASSPEKGGVSSNLIMSIEEESKESPSDDSSYSFHGTISSVNNLCSGIHHRKTLSTVPRASVLIRGSHNISSLTSPAKD